MKRVKILLLITSLLCCYVLGVYCGKNENIMRFFRLTYYKAQSISFSNYMAGVNSTPPSIELIIPDSSKAILKECRDSAVAADILRDKFKIKVPAHLVFNNDTLKVKVRLKGDYSDHWSGDKWSYRVYVKGDNNVFGMKSFSIQNPKTRGMLNEWYFHSLMRHEGLIALRNNYVSLIENGEEKGIYHVEESFNKLLLENNGRRESPILKFDESILIDSSKINATGSHTQEDLFKIAKVDLFNTKQTLKTPALYENYRRGKFLLENFRAEKIELNEAFDINKAALNFAIADFVGGHHALRWKNVRFYYNPIIGKLELISFDANSGGVINDIYYNKWKEKELYPFDELAWKNLFFKDTKFVNLYIEHLRRLSSPDFLENFHKSIMGELNKNASYIHKDYPLEYLFQIDTYTKNVHTIRRRLALLDQKEKEISSNYFVISRSVGKIALGDDQIHVSIANNAKDEIHILGVFNKEKQKISNANSTLLKGREDLKVSNEEFFSFNLSVPIDTSQVLFKRKKNRWVHKRLSIGFTYPSGEDTLYSRIEVFYETNPMDIGGVDLPIASFSVDHENKTVKVKPGNWTFERDIVTPEGYSVLCGENTHLTFNNTAVFVLNGPINFRGTKDAPITITSEDTTGSFFVCQANGLSHLENVHFDNLSECNHGKWILTGAVNFYQSDVKMNNITFTNNSSEDALNLFQSKFEIAQCTFRNISSDAIDLDFCKGFIMHCNMDAVGNDALDFSGSFVSLNDISIRSFEDKGISVGEKSTVIGSNLKIENGEIGIVVKDLSQTKLDLIEIDQVAVPFVVFQKKSEFGPGQISLTNFNSKNFREEFLLESKSRATINGQKITPNYTDIKPLLYGNIYGKKTE